MKKLLSLILSLCLLAGIFCVSAEAISLDSTRAELNAEFLDGIIRGMDYVYFSPIKKNDTTKYPLMIWLHGNASGDEPRGQIKYRGFSNWASDEFQARFKDSGGCILFAPRANSFDNSWSNVSESELKKVIDLFIEKYEDNVDFSRIYIGGYSVGADMTWDMLLEYPKFFAAGLPCSAITPPTSIEVVDLTDTSVWCFNCDTDFWLTARSEVIKPVFDTLSDKSNRKEGIRLTTLTETVLADGTKQGSYQEEHYTWETVTYDMHMADHVTPYAYSTTVDGTGALITFNNPEVGVIDWLYRQTNEREDEGKGDTPLMRFFRRILEYIRLILESITM